MYCCVEKTFITVKLRTQSRRSVSLPARLHEPTPEPNGLETLMERASALISDFEMRNTNGDVKAQASLPVCMAPERNDRHDVASECHPFLSFLPLSLLEDKETDAEE